MIEVGRKYLIVLVAVLGSAGCATSPNTKTDGLDARLAWPCERLIVAWAIDVRELQALVGDELRIKADKGFGKLQLSIMQCEPPATAQNSAVPLVFGTFSVPVTAESAPIVITNIPADGWSSLLQLFADDNTQALFSQMGYDVLAADISVVANETRMDVELTFDGGQIAIAANATSDFLGHEAERALLSRGMGFVSAFFGPEKGLRTSSGSATVQIQGETPLSSFDLPKIPTTARLDSAIVSNRVFWRLPTAPP